MIDGAKNWKSEKARLSSETAALAQTHYHAFEHLRHPPMNCRRYCPSGALFARASSSLDFAT